MRLLLTAILPGGVDVDFTLSPHDIRKQMREEDGLRDAIVQPMKIDLHVSKVRETVQCRGSWQIQMKPTCDRCLEPFDLNLDEKMRLTCMPAEQVAEEDEGLYGYHSDALDLDAIVCSQMFLGLPMTYYCAPDCKGLCLECGRNLNQDSCSCQRCVA